MIRTIELAEISKEGLLALIDKKASITASENRQSIDITFAVCVKIEKITTYKKDAFSRIREDSYIFTIAGTDYKVLPQTSIEMLA